ncbi:AcrR family transcriptional regulator [Microbacterium foliorum]|uniref:TetR family transcriptional regulator n=1 Tax=Microbacterium foliorum TaxID=104336 RepID=UPI00209D5901|nr:TetR/AcrR family transcriptional regulator [Microbacterium foliorum]MCP1427808.1 AcrR family transcriptional regulator [Microbacterium foliorum]
MGSRSDQKAATRESILLAAAQQFAEHGYAATSISGIAARMGKPKSALSYSQFRSKLDIANAIVERQLEVWKLLIERVEHADPGLPRLLTLLVSAAADARTSPFGPAAIRLVLESHEHHLFELPYTGQSWFEYAYAQVGEAVALGQLPPATDPREVGYLILSASFGVYEANKNGFRLVDPDRALRMLWTGLLREAGVADPAAIVDVVHVVALDVEY